MDITIHASFLPHDDPDASRAFPRDGEVEVSRSTRCRSSGMTGSPGAHRRVLNELSDRELMRDGRWLVRRLDRERGVAGPRGATGRREGEPDVLREPGQIEPGDADGEREGGPASQTETR